MKFLKIEKIGKSKLCFIELTQKTIIGEIITLVRDEDWGDPRKYDLVIERIEGEITKYSVIAKPPKDMDEEISEEYKNTPINLEVIFDGGDPFDPMNQTKKEVKDSKKDLKEEKIEAQVVQKELRNSEDDLDNKSQKELEAGIDLDSIPF